MATNLMTTLKPPACLTKQVHPSELKLGDKIPTVPEGNYWTIVGTISPTAEEPRYTLQLTPRLYSGNGFMTVFVPLNTCVIITVKRQP